VSTLVVMFGVFTTARGSRPGFQRMLDDLTTIRDETSTKPAAPAPAERSTNDRDSVSEPTDGGGDSSILWIPPLSCQVLAAQLDLADRTSVAAFVAGWRGPLHILVNWAGDGITVNAVMPGVVRTNLMRHANPEVLARARESGVLEQLPWKTVEQGAATSVLVGASPLLEGVGGRYFEDCGEA
jgi:NAD(P)-dependent dehydrogenase (short-subunit alcohol dehydrogenase family)